jgi:hypothetical protein
MQYEGLGDQGPPYHSPGRHLLLLFEIGGETPVRRLPAILAATVILASGASTRAANVKPIEIRGHSIGETSAVFLSLETAAQQEADACRKHPDETRCAHLLAALDGGQRAEISTSGAMAFVLDGGKLVRLTIPVDGVADAAMSELTKKFGPQPRKVTIQGQNIQGAKWENYLFAWDTPDAYVTLYQDNDPLLQGRRLLLVVEARSQGREDTVSVKRLGASRKRTAEHPPASASPTGN